jgi:hypothetical protein
VIASIEGQAFIDKILQHLRAKGALPPPPDLLPATRESPALDWFAEQRVSAPTTQHTTATDLNRLPDGLLPELSRKARKAVEEGVFSRKSRVLNRIRSDRQKIPVHPALSFLPRYVGVLRLSFLILSYFCKTISIVEAAQTCCWAVSRLIATNDPDYLGR